MNGWKKYGAVAMAAVVLVGACAEGGTLYTSRSVNAEETEETQRITLNIVSDHEDETEGGAPSETEEVIQNAGGDAQMPSETIAEASETEESERVTLNRGGSSDDATEDGTEAAENVTEASETEEDRETQEASDETEASDVSESTGDVTLGSASSIGTVESSTGGIVTTDVSEVVENCLPSIVSVTAYTSEEIDSALSSYYDPEEEETEDASVATGIIIAQNEEELLIVTSYHTVSSAELVSVAFSVDAEDAEDLEVSARVKSSSSSYDLAVLAVEISDIKESMLEQLKVANLGSSEDLKIGQAAILISNALGSGSGATVGVISALDRTVTVNEITVDAILTDTAVSTGSSGGALLNASGEVIGICLSDASENGVGYSLPIDTVIPVLEQLINKETRDKLSDSERGYIGATVVTVSDEAVSTYGMPAGAFVYSVTEGSAAEAAGIQSGDIISALEGESVSSSDELIEKMSYYAPGETITLEVQTAIDGTYEAREVEVTLQEGSSDTSSADSSEETEEDAAIPDENEASEGEIFNLPFGEDEKEDDYYSEDDGSSEGGNRDGFSYDFDDGFSDGFEDYNSQFR